MHQEHMAHRLHSGLGANSGKLDTQAMLLLAVNGLLAAANALSGTFMGVYLWKAKHDFAVVGWLTLATHAAMALTFWLAGKWVKEHNKMNSLRLGVAISACFYFLVLWLGSRSVHYVLLLGVVQGMASGFFWLAFNVVYCEVTNPHNRDRFNGWAGLLGSGAGIVGPWISGLLIVRMTGASGYRLMFSISLGIYLVGVLVSFFLKKRKAQGEYDWLLPLRCLRQKGPWRRVCAALVAQGVREGVFGFMIGLMVYLATRSEAKLGGFSLITSSVALVSYWLAGKFVKPRYRSAAMLAGVCGMVAVIVPFFWKVGYVTLLLFGVSVSLFYPLFTIPMTSTVFDLIGQDEESAKQREEYIVLRELSLNLGRMLGTGLFLGVVSWRTDTLVVNWLLLVIGSSPLASWAFMRKQLKTNSA